MFVIFGRIGATPYILSWFHRCLHLHSYHIFHLYVHVITYACVLISGSFSPLTLVCEKLTELCILQERYLMYQVCSFFLFFFFLFAKKINQRSDSQIFHPPAPPRRIFSPHIGTAERQKGCLHNSHCLVFYNVRMKNM